MRDSSRGSPAPRIPGLRDSVPGAAYKKGDVIGQDYEVHGILGAGGCGVVYLVYSKETMEVCALKTFRDEYLADAQARERFRREAGVWIDLERHPYLVRAHVVTEIAGRLFVAMEHIAPDENGLNSLEGYLRQRPPDFAQSLRWAIQLCHGMEYAYSRGIRCHRDIKPANILVAQGKTAKITDFGLAGVLVASRVLSDITTDVEHDAYGLPGQTIVGTGFGTPLYMPPEQFYQAASCDERSDIYALGVVLYQMASGGRIPFSVPLPKAVAESERARFWREMHRMHARAPVPRLDSSMFPIIQRCLQKEPDRRYQSIGELRQDLEPLLHRLTGETIKLPDAKALQAWEWGNKGVSLDYLGRNCEAARCHDKALDLDPRNAAAWNNKGNSLQGQGRHEEADRCYDRALALDPRHVAAWNNKGASLVNLGRHEEAARCLDKALELDPQYTVAWSNKGYGLHSQGHYEEAIRCCDEALALDPRHVAAWNNKGISLHSLGRYEEAVHHYDRALELSPRDRLAWCNKGISLVSLDRPEEAIRCHDRALELDPGDATVWSNKGQCLRILGRLEEAFRCYTKALELDPGNARACIAMGGILGSLGRHEEEIRCYYVFLNHYPCVVEVWKKSGFSLYRLGRHEEAVRCYDRVLGLDPQDGAAWRSKGISLAKLGQHKEAISCYDRALEQRPLAHRSNVGSGWPTSVWAVVNKGDSLRELGRYEEALRCYDKALEVDARGVAAHRGRGHCLCDLGRHEDAVCCYDKVHELAPKDAGAWYHKALAQEGLGRTHDAVRSYQQFIAFASAEDRVQVECARRRVRELEGK